MQYMKRGEYSTVPDAANPRKYKPFCNPNWKGLPKIISFTEFLRWNYTSDYGTYIRKLHENHRLPMPHGVPEKARIKNVTISKGRYDQANHDLFYMYIICVVDFSWDHYCMKQEYLVYGYYSLIGVSDFFTDIDLYYDKYIWLKKPLDEYLVPVIKKNKFDDIAKQMVMEFLPNQHGYAYRIDGASLAHSMGYEIQYVRLSRNGKLKSKLIFSGKDVSVYDKIGSKQVIHVLERTILIDKAAVADREDNAIIHECVHAYLYRIFYKLQSLYFNIVGKDAPEFDDYFYSQEQRDTLHWMETQANCIALRIQMPEDETTEAILSFFDNHEAPFTFDTYRKLIDFISRKFGSSRYGAKKRMIELGWKEVRGVYEYALCGYVEDYEVPYDFPLDCTYTLPLSAMADAYAMSDDFAALVRSKRYIYVDGHMCRNEEKYILWECSCAIGLTDYAKHHMSECCIDFKRIYDNPEYSYTYGELNKEELMPIISGCLTEAQRKKLHDRMLEMEEEERELKKSSSNDAFASAVKFHMKRCGITADELAYRSGMGISSITKMRNGGAVKLEIILAFCVALELEDHYRIDLMQKAGVQFNMKLKKHRTYAMILDIMPEANVFQINDYLRSEGMTPWTQERENRQASAV